MRIWYAREARPGDMFTFNEPVYDEQGVRVQPGVRATVADVRAHDVVLQRADVPEAPLVVLSDALGAHRRGNNVAALLLCGRDGFVPPSGPAAARLTVLADPGHGRADAVSAAQHWNSADGAIDALIADARYHQVDLSK